MSDRELLAELLRNVDHFGEAHIVVSDLNVDDENIGQLLHNPNATDDERTIARLLLAMPEDEREPFLLKIEQE